MSWDRELESGLPDSRLKVHRDKEQKQARPLGSMWLDRVFCANCGCDGGLATPDLAFLHYICAECAAKCGTPPGTAMVPGTECM